MDYPEPDTEEYDAYLANMTDVEYEDFVSTFLLPNTLEKIFVGIFAVIMLVGVIGNTLVVVVVISKRSMWSSMNILLANLACADLLVLLFCLPPTVINDVTKTFWFSNVFCKSIIFCQNTSVYVSIQSLMFISFERWRAITFPLKRPIRATRTVVIGTWLAATVVSLPEPLTLSVRHAIFNRPNFTTTWGSRCAETWSPEFEQHYQIFYSVVFYVFPLLLISCLCMHMRNTLKNAQMSMGKRQLAHRRKAIRMLCAVVFVFALSYLPVHWYNLTSAYTKLGGDTSSEEDEDDIDLNWIALRKLTPRLFSYSSCLLNPIVYNFMCSKFRNEFARVVCCRASTDSMVRFRNTTARLQRQNNSIFTGGTLCGTIGSGSLVRHSAVMLTNSMDSLARI